GDSRSSTWARWAAYSCRRRAAGSSTGGLRLPPTVPIHCPPIAPCSACRHSSSYWFRWFISKPGTRWKSPGKDLDLCSLRSRPPRYAQLGQHPLLFPLPFVRGVVCGGGGVAPRFPAALLGRFLPRLGPLASRKRPFFLV